MYLCSYQSFSDNEVRCQYCKKKKHTIFPQDECYSDIIIYWTKYLSGFPASKLKLGYSQLPKEESRKLFPTKNLLSTRCRRRMTVTSNICCNEESALFAQHNSLNSIDHKTWAMYETALYTNSNKLFSDNSKELHTVVIQRGCRQR